MSGPGQKEHVYFPLHCQISRCRPQNLLTIYSVLVLCSHPILLLLCSTSLLTLRILHMIHYVVVPV
uniref:Uncharacterized protein n=1 Tax=Arundo donax TaxID=35708 RepID=A0A0A9GBM4_ARUDO